MKHAPCLVWPVDDKSASRGYGLGTGATRGGGGFSPEGGHQRHFDRDGPPAPLLRFAPFRGERPKHGNRTPSPNALSAKTFCFICRRRSRGWLRSRACGISASWDSLLPSKRGAYIRNNVSAAREWRADPITAYAPSPRLQVLYFQERAT
jgi:hypothetical protein